MNGLKDQNGGLVADCDLSSNRGTRVELSPPFNAKLCKISGECGEIT